jgi:acyl carrier protein
MTLRERLTQCFTKAFGIAADRVCDQLAYNSIKEWDSLAHMALVAEIESTFSIQLDTDEILGMGTFAKALEIVTAHGVT